MVTTINDIKSTDWQPKIDEIGAVVEGLEDIEQCLNIILNTPQGSDPHRPLFGTNILQYLDSPVNIAVPNIIREAVEAIETWETRIKLLAIRPVIDGDQITLRIEWQPVGEEERSYVTNVEVINNGAS